MLTCFFQENLHDLCRKLAESDKDAGKNYVLLLMNAKKWKEAEGVIESAHLDPWEFPLFIKKSMKNAIKSFLYDKMRVTNLLSLTQDNVYASAALCEALFEFSEEAWVSKVISYILSAHPSAVPLTKKCILDVQLTSPSIYIPQDDKFSPNNDGYAEMPKIPIYFIRSEQDVESMNIDKNEVVALDSEWRTPLGKFQHTKSAILQIATPSAVFIIDLIALHQSTELDSKLFQVFGSSQIMKLGIGFDGDLGKLRESYPDMICFKETMYNYVDLITVHKKSRNKDPGGLASLSELHFEIPMCKAEQKSNWEQRPLTLSQFHYAALDAYICLGIYQIFLNEKIHLKTYAIDLGGPVERDGINYPTYPSCEVCKNKLHNKENCPRKESCKICGVFAHSSNECPCFISSY